MFFLYLWLKNKREIRSSRDIRPNRLNTIISKRNAIKIVRCTNFLTDIIHPRSWKITKNTWHKTYPCYCRIEKFKRPHKSKYKNIKTCTNDTIESFLRIERDTKVVGYHNTKWDDRNRWAKISLTNDCSSIDAHVD